MSTLALSEKFWFTYTSSPLSVVKRSRSTPTDSISSMVPVTDSILVIRRTVAVTVSP